MIERIRRGAAEWAAGRAKWKFDGRVWTLPRPTVEQQEMAAQVVFEADGENSPRRHEEKKIKGDAGRGTIGELGAALMVGGYHARLLAIILVPEGEEFEGIRVGERAELMRRFPAEWGQEALHHFFCANQKSCGAILMAAAIRRPTKPQ